MKRIAAFLLAAALLLSTTACSAWVKDDYLSVDTHVEQPSSVQMTEEEPQPPTVTDRGELRGAVLKLIRDWVEDGTILVRDYEGDISEDLSDTLRYATEEDPIGAYAVDFADAELDGDATKGTIALRIVFRRSAAEINSIVTVYGNDAAYQKIQAALANYDSALTLRIRSFEDTDFAEYIRRFCLEHPEKSFALPELSAEIYPKAGQTRILELHFVYPAARDEMRRMQDSVNTILSSASSYIRSGKDALERASLLFRFLTTRFAYPVSDEEPAMPAYSLLCEGVAHSLSFSSVFYAECAAADVECRMVSGTLDGAPRYWNQLCVDGEYYYVDLLRGVERSETELTLLTTQELSDEGYVWEQDSYPATPEPSEATEESETGWNAGETTHTEEPTESTPTESSSETADASSEESTEPTETTEPSESSEEEPQTGSRLPGGTRKSGKS